MNLYEFMPDSPILTFFIALIIGEVLETLFKAIFSKRKESECE